MRSKTVLTWAVSVTLRCLPLPRQRREKPVNRLGLWSKVLTQVAHTPHPTSGQEGQRILLTSPGIVTLRLVGRQRRNECRNLTFSRFRLITILVRLLFLCIPSFCVCRVCTSDAPPVRVASTPQTFTFALYLGIFICHAFRIINTILSICHKGHAVLAPRHHVMARLVSVSIVCSTSIEDKSSR